MLGLPWQVAHGLSGRGAEVTLVAAHRLPAAVASLVQSTALGVWASGVAAPGSGARARYCGTQALLPLVACMEPVGPYMGSGGFLITLTT